MAEAKPEKAEEAGKMEENDSLTELTKDAFQKVGDYLNGELKSKWSQSYYNDACAHPLFYPIKTIEMVCKSVIYKMRGSLCHKKQKVVKKFLLKKNLFIKTLRRKVTSCVALFYM